MAVRVATFNVENLFARYRFREGREPLAASGFGINDLAFDVYDDTAKRITARAIREIQADIVCLQEVENLQVLERFNSIWLGGMNYKHRLLIDAHDPRFIDVAVLSRYPFTYINTHRNTRNAANTTWLFSRDCLEVDVAVEGKILSLYVNHFKSMIGGRAATRPRRAEQVAAVAAIVDQYWHDSQYPENFVVLGDFNDYVGTDTSLNALLKHPQLVNVVDRLPQDERWTHFWAGGNEYRQLDYLLLSKALAELNTSVTPSIMRQGLPYRATQYTGERFEDIGEDNPKASDHAALSMDLTLL